MAIQMWAPRVFMGEYELSGQLTQATINYGAEPLDATVATSTTRIRVGGLKTVGFAYSGYVSGGSSGGMDQSLYDDVGVSNVPVTCVPLTSVSGSTQAIAQGATAYLFRALETEYQTFGEVGTLLPFSITAECDDRLVRGAVLLHEIQANSTSGAGVFSTGGYSLGGSSGQTVFASLNAVGNYSTALAVTVRSNPTSASTGVGTLRMTFTSLNGRGSDWQTAAGTTDTWWFVSGSVVGGVATTDDLNFIVGIGAAYTT